MFSVVFNTAVTVDCAAVSEGGVPVAVNVAVDVAPVITSVVSNVPLVTLIETLLAFDRLSKANQVAPAT